MVKQAAIKTKGGSGLDTDGWRRILASNSYGNTNVDFRRAFAEMIKKLCTTKIQPDADSTSIEAFLACRLIPLVKIQVCDR